MNRRAAALLQKAPKILHVIMVNAAATDSQPLAFARLHQLQRDVGVLEMFAGADRFQIGAAEDESICTQRITEGVAGQSPTLDLALTRAELGAGAHQPADGIADVEQVSEVGAERTHLRRGQIITLHAERWRKLLQGAHG